MLRWSALGAACLCGIGILSAQEPAQAPPTRPSFSECLDGVRADALARGIRPEIIAQPLSTGLEPASTFIDRYRTQADIVLTLETYLIRQLRPSVIRTARQMFNRHRPVLDEIGKRYGVSPRLIVSIWGL